MVDDDLLASRVDDFEVRRPVSQGDRPRPELMAIHQLELDALAQTGEQRRPVSGKDRLHTELVLVDSPLPAWP